MTSYSAMAARGREAAREATAGRRKRIAERIEYGEPVAHQNGYTTVEARLIGTCGHTLRWLAAVPVRDGEPQPGLYLTAKVGRRMTCDHDDCRIEPSPAPPT